MFHVTSRLRVVWDRPRPFAISRGFILLVQQGQVVAFGFGQLSITSFHLGHASLGRPANIPDGERVRWCTYYVNSRLNFKWHLLLIWLKVVKSLFLSNYTIFSGPGRPIKRKTRSWALGPRLSRSFSPYSRDLEPQF